MKNKIEIKIHPADVSTELNIEFIESGIHAGFPSPASDFMDSSIDLNKFLIQHPSSTFFARVRGTSMINSGIGDGDLLIIDKSLDPSDKKIAVCFLDGEFTIKRLKKEKDSLYLVAENTEFKPIKIEKESDFIVWGIVTKIIKDV